MSEERYTIGLVAGSQEPVYGTYERRDVRFVDGELAEKVMFSEAPKGSGLELITHVRVFTAEGAIDVPLSVPLSLCENVSPVLVALSTRSFSNEGDEE